VVYDQGIHIALPWSQFQTEALTEDCSHRLYAVLFPSELEVVPTRNSRLIDHLPAQTALQCMGELLHGGFLQAYVPVPNPDARLPALRALQTRRTGHGQHEHIEWTNLHVRLQPQPVLQFLAQQYA